MANEIKYTMPLLEDLTAILQERGLSLSYQRLKVLEYLVSHHCHPSVEQMYLSLVEEIPTLSKATVYNTLKTLVEIGIVKEMQHFIQIVASLFFTPFISSGIRKRFRLLEKFFWKFLCIG